MLKKIYFASPLFSEMELQFNAQFVGKIRKTYPELEVYLPQEQGDINDKQAYADSKMIAKYDTDALLDSQLMVAILDGVSIDVGVASEIGIAFQAGIPIIGLYSDSRQQGYDNQQKIQALSDIAESQFPYINLYTVGLIKQNGTILNTSAKLITEIKKYL